MLLNLANIEICANICMHNVLPTIKSLELVKLYRAVCLNVSFPQIRAVAGARPLPKKP